MKYTYGVPDWLMKKYLTDLGGAETGEHAVIGDDWQAVISKGEPYRIGSLVCGRIDLDITGDEAIIEPLLEKLDRKSLRGGG